MTSAFRSPSTSPPSCSTSTGRWSIPTTSTSRRGCTPSTPAGCGVDAWRIHESIGMDSSQAAGSADRRARPMPCAIRPRTSTASGTRKCLSCCELSTALATCCARSLRADVKVVLATSAPQDELERLRDLLDVEDAIETVTNAEDVETAKPAPDIVQVALEKSGVDASETHLRRRHGVGRTRRRRRRRRVRRRADRRNPRAGAARRRAPLRSIRTIRELRADLEARGLA